MVSPPLDDKHPLERLLQEQPSPSSSAASSPLSGAPLTALSASEHSAQLSGERTRNSAATEQMGQAQEVQLLLGRQRQLVQATGANQQQWRRRGVRRAKGQQMTTSAQASDDEEQQTQLAHHPHYHQRLFEGRASGRASAHPTQRPTTNSRMTRQLSDGHLIDAQMKLNVLKLNDDLASSQNGSPPLPSAASPTGGEDGPPMNAGRSGPQQDCRLRASSLSSSSGHMSSQDATHQQVAASVPLVVVSSIDQQAQLSSQQQQQHGNYFLNQTQLCQYPHTNYQAHLNDDYLMQEAHIYHSQYAGADRQSLPPYTGHQSQLMPLFSAASLYQHQPLQLINEGAYSTHNHHHQLHHDEELLIAPHHQAGEPQAQPNSGLNYVDLDEETRQHNERFSRQSLAAERGTAVDESRSPNSATLPESVVDANNESRPGEQGEHSDFASLYSPYKQRQPFISTNAEHLDKENGDKASPLPTGSSQTTLISPNLSSASQPTGPSDYLNWSRLPKPTRVERLRTADSSNASGVDQLQQQQHSADVYESQRNQPQQRQSEHFRSSLSHGSRGIELGQQQQYQNGEQLDGVLHRATTSSGRTIQSASSPNIDFSDEAELKVCEWGNCNNTFLDMHEFVRHLEEQHVNVEPREKNRYFCLWRDCKRNKQEFNARYKLLIHMRVHSGEKPYSCQSRGCKKSFSRLENLKIHVRSHTGEKPYKCNYEHCSKSFTNSSDRIKHHKTHKDPKPYNCLHENCTKRYTDPSSLRKHLRAHKRHSECDGGTAAGARLALSNSAASSINMQYSASTTLANRLPADQFSEQSLLAATDERHHHDSRLAREQQPAQQALAPPHQQQAYAYNSGLGEQRYCHQMAAEPQHDSGQLEQAYLCADYDPSEEFASVLAPAPEPAGHFNAGYERFKQRQFQHHFSDDNLHGHQPHSAASNQSGARHWSASRAKGHLNFHEQLSRSWCVGGAGPVKACGESPLAGGAQIQSSGEWQATTSVLTQASGTTTAAKGTGEHIDNWPNEALHSGQARDWRPGNQQQLANSNQQPPCRPSQYCAMSPHKPAGSSSLQQAGYESWPGEFQNNQREWTQTAYDNDQRQLHQLQPQNRRQQHEQLMRSMPTNAVLFRID